MDFQYFNYTETDALTEDNVCFNV